MAAKQQTSSISSSTLQQKIGTVLRRVAVGGEHIIIERNRYPTAVIIPVADYKTFLHNQTQQPSSESVNRLDKQGGQGD